MRMLIISLFCLMLQEERQVGMASYYSDKFQGRKTASGETYDKEKFTAAHRSLPFGTVVWVKNIKSMDSVQVRINDRGPHVKGRIIDVSRAAAIKLNMLNAGKAKVEVWEVDSGQ
ncbi:MAG: septal ring lytic transglycosylase RlpA family protein [Bacteroidetes bacterium]|nr:septal ring lytic transglycosylase RlpA family protein [Bacteroidota bacterium]